MMTYNWTNECPITATIDKQRQWKRRITSSRFKTLVTKNHRRWRHPLQSKRLYPKSKETIIESYKSHISNPRNPENKIQDQPQQTTNEKVTKGQ